MVKRFNKTCNITKRALRPVMVASLGMSKAKSVPSFGTIQLFTWMVQVLLLRPLKTTVLPVLPLCEDSVGTTGLCCRSCREVIFDSVELWGGHGVVVPRFRNSA